MQVVAASEPLLLTMISPNQAEADWVRQLCAKSNAGLVFASATSPDMAAQVPAGNIFLLDLDALGLASETDHLRVIDELAHRGAVVVVTDKADIVMEQLYLDHGAVDVMQRRELTPMGLRRALRAVVTRRHSDRQLSRLQLRDPATGLAAAPLFWEFLGLAERRARRNRDFFAIMLIDVAPRLASGDDRDAQLSPVEENAMMGILAERLQHMTRASDTLARLERRQFGILAEAMPRVEDVQIVAEKIISELTQPVTAQGRIGSVSVAVGIALYPTSANAAEELISHATAALQQAIARGRNDFAFG